MAILRVSTQIRIFFWSVRPNSCRRFLTGCCYWPLVVVIEKFKYNSVSILVVVMETLQDDDSSSTVTELVALDVVDQHSYDSEATESAVDAAEILVADPEEDEETELDVDEVCVVDLDDDDDDDDDEDEDHVDPATNKRKSRSGPLCVFTTGLGFSAVDKSQLRGVVESASSKKQFSGGFKPSQQLSNLIIRWGRKPSYNFSGDILNSCFVVAHEMGLDSAFQLCNLRGWIVTMPTLRDQSKAPFLIQHKRFHACLKNADLPPDHRGLHLLGIIKSAHDILQTSVLPPTEDSEVASPETEKRQSTKLATKTKPLSAANQRKSARSSAHFELVYVHDPASFQMRVTQNTKCVQIALFLMGFIFALTIPTVTVESKTKLYFSMFSACFSSRRFVELCHRLLVFFDTPIPDPDKVRQVTDNALGKDANTTLHDCMSGKVTIDSVATAALHEKLEKDIVVTFKRTSIKNHNERKAAEQLLIMRYVVVSMFVRYEGNQMDASKKAPKSNSAVRKALTDPMVVTPNKVPGSPLSTSSFITGQRHKQPRIQVDRPTLVNELAITVPTNLRMPSLCTLYREAQGSVPLPSYSEHEMSCT
jgi:hypothetical protein